MKLRLPFLRKTKDITKQESKGWTGIMFDAFRTDPQWFQKGFSPNGDQEVAMTHAAVAACVTILSQEVARLRIEHYVSEKDGSRTKKEGSAISRVLRRPNAYQTRSDFFLHLMRNLLLSGNAYAIAVRGTMGNVVELHPRPSREVQPWIVPETGEVYYSISQKDLDKQIIQATPEKYLVPSRNVLHIKLDTPSHPLVGVTPLTGCQYAVPQGIAIQRDSTSFFSRMSRPSGVLTTPNKLGPDAAKRLKERWEAGMSDNFQGRTAVLDNDLKWLPLTMTAADSQLIEQYKMTVEDVAMVYRVPLYMLGDLTKATFSNVEAMQKAFQAGSLGFYTEHIEASLDSFFGLSPQEYIEFDMERGIIRTELETRMSAHSKGVQGGILTINEARAKDHLPPVKGGDKTYLQRQNWPIDLLGADAVKEIQQAAGGTSTSDSTEEDASDTETDAEETAFMDSTLRHLQLIQGGQQ